MVMGSSPVDLVFEPERLVPVFQALCRRVSPNKALQPTAAAVYGLPGPQFP